MRFGQKRRPRVKVSNTPHRGNTFHEHGQKRDHGPNQNQQRMERTNISGFPKCSTKMEKDKPQALLDRAEEVAATNVLYESDSRLVGVQHQPLSLALKAPHHAFEVLDIPGDKLG